ncbi:MAG: response regulator transcription factor [Nitriliruptorales bacterium]|nr:response regulator transcription factor [Nitriliruptorales bacterium]
MHVLVVDDDRAVRESLDRALRLHGYDVSLAEHGLDALQAVEEGAPDAIVLDVMMPGLDGFAVTRRLRQDGDDTPILMLTARDAVEDRVEGLEVGADDYLVKPFALEELVARLRALLRRTVSDDDAGDQDSLEFEDLTLDVAGMTATRGGESIHLTRTEFLLLELFLRHPGQVLERDLILDRVWGFDTETSSNALEVYVGYLRRKLGEPRLIHTVRGVGYVLRSS